MSRTTLKVKGLPAGWRVLQFKQSSSDPSSAVILCERHPHREDDVNFVTWRANLVMGGCHLGHYHDSLRDAESDFAKRSQSL